MKERVVNIRPLFVIFVGVILGILTFYYGINAVLIGKDIAQFVILLVVLFLVLIAFALSFIPKFYFGIFLKKIRYVLLAFIISLMIGTLLISFRVQQYRTMNYLHGTYSCTGYVDECVLENRNLKIFMTDCIVSGDANYNIDNLNLTIVDCDERIAVGTRISFTGKISSTKLLTDENNIGKFYKDKVYQIVVSSDDITIGDIRDTSIVEKIRDGIRYSLEENLNSENSAIAYAMLLGDKSGLDTENYNMFSYAGVSHILAVSGLHVGFLVGLLILILSLFKTKDSTNLIVVSLILAIYCILCKMSPSVVRASIMSIVMLASKCIGEEYDALSSLSLAGIIILLLNPVQLFDVGFQLSFLCVLSIITISKYVTEMLVKSHIPKALASILSLSFCINLAIYPLCTNIFETTSLLGVFSNLIIIPLFSVVFPVLFVSAVFSTIFPFMGFIMIVPEMLLHAIKVICTWITSIRFGNFIVFSWGYLVVFLTILILLVIKFLMLKPRIKNFVVAGLLSVVVALVIVGEIPKHYQQNSILTWSQYSTATSVVVTDKNYKILIDYDKYSMSKALKNYKISKINEWVYPSFDLTKIDNTIEIVEKYKIDKVVLPKYDAFNSYSLAKLEEVIEIVYVEDNTTFENYSLDFYMSDVGKTYAVEITTTKRILFDICMTQSQMESFEGKKRVFDYCITQNDDGNIKGYITGINTAISVTKGDENNENGVKSIGQKSQHVIEL